MNKMLSRLSGLACTAAMLAFTGFAAAQPPQNHKDGHFDPADRGRFTQHYQSDAHQWAGRQDRPHFEAGQALPRNYHVQPVPSSYWGGAPPPPGYSYGYYDGYVVSYNPTTRVIADVLDLATQ